MMMVMMMIMMMMVMMMINYAHAVDDRRHRIKAIELLRQGTVRTKASLVRTLCTEKRTNTSCRNVCYL